MPRDRMTHNPDGHYALDGRNSTLLPLLLHRPLQMASVTIRGALGLLHCKPTGSANFLDRSIATTGGSSDKAGW